MLVVYGIQLLENLRLDELAAARVQEFALVVQPSGWSGRLDRPLRRLLCDEASTRARRAIPTLVHEASME